MDGGNDWHVIRGAAAAAADACGSAGAQDKTIFNRIMLRFRPIAPKPANGTDLDSSSSKMGNKHLLASKKTRRKRKYVRVSKSNNLKKNKRVPAVPPSDQEKERERDDFKSVVVLQLLPERSESKDHESQERMGKTWCNNDIFQDLAVDITKESVDDQEKQEQPMWLKRKHEKERERDDFNSVVTLQLLPERSESKDHESQERMGKTWCNKDIFQGLAVDNTKESVDDQEKQEQPMWLKFKLKQPMIEGYGKQGQMLVTVPQKRETTVVESRVTLECGTDIYRTCMDGRAILLGCTDVERMRNLEEDTCPGFISDGLNHVQWINGAYKKMVEMVTKEDNKERAQLYNTVPEVMVWLVIKEKLLPFVDCASAFSCCVRLQNSWQKEKCSQMIVPCDVWRMDRGGFAWRLDVEAALSLGR